VGTQYRHGPCIVQNNANILRRSKCDIREATGTYVYLRPRNLNRGTGRAGFPLLGPSVGNTGLLPTPHPLKPWVRSLLFPFSVQISLISEHIYGGPEKGRTCSSFTPFDSLPESSSWYLVTSFLTVQFCADKVVCCFQGKCFFFFFNSSFISGKGTFFALSPSVPWNPSSKSSLFLNLCT
jgi:hypothetical protein